MELKAVELSPQALRGIGVIIIPREWPAINDDSGFHYAETNGALGLESTLSSGSLDCAPRPKTLKKMERHLKTREMLVALKGESIVCLAPPQEPSGGSLQGITAVRVKAGDVFILETGAWHWIPFPVGTQAARFLVVFKARTGQDDLYFCDLAESRTVNG
jgi:ureidoglycolate hydrolase